MAPPRKHRQVGDVQRESMTEAAKRNLEIELDFADDGSQEKATSACCVSYRRSSRNRSVSVTLRRQFPIDRGSDVASSVSCFPRDAEEALCWPGEERQVGAWRGATSLQRCRLDPQDKVHGGGLSPFV